MITLILSNEFVQFLMVILGALACFAGVALLVLILLAWDSHRAQKEKP